MSHRFHPDARDEFVAAVEWYEARNRGQGLDFARQVERAISLAAGFTHAWPRVSGSLRRVLVHRYPYAVIYGLEGQVPIIFAVMHSRRRPGYWLKRLPA